MAWKAGSNQPPPLLSNWSLIVPLLKLSLLMQDLMNELTRSICAQELESIASTFNIPVRWIATPLEEPFAVVELQSEEAVKKLTSRSILVRSAFELWGQATTHDELCSELKCLPEDLVAPYCHEQYTFKICVETFCKSLTLQRKLEKIEELAFLPLKGSIQLKDPDYEFYLLEHYGSNPNNIPDKPYNIFFGRWICNGCRNAVSKLTLKKRKFIGNTSMDAQLSLIMANQAKVQSGSLVLDPFVGTGSLLVAAAYFGGYVLGTDIDYLIIHGKAKPTRYNQKKREPDENVLSNLRQYGLERNYLDILIADSALPLWKTQPMFDAIVTDPPYGIREATERIGTHRDYKIKDEHIRTHIPSKVNYCLSDLLKDLLEFASCMLMLGGRLVYWLPVYKVDYSEASIPTHPCMRLVSNSEQSLTKQSSRRLITMEKIKEPKVLSPNMDVNIPETITSFRDRYFQVLPPAKQNNN